MSKINTIITGIADYVPDYVLNNEELSRMVDTNDEWITTRTGIREHRVLIEEGLGTSYMARKATKLLMTKTSADPDSIDAVVVVTSTPDYPHPSTTSIISGKLGLKDASASDLAVACCGFMYALDATCNMVQSGRHKRIIVTSADKMSATTDYRDRATCPLFDDGTGAVMLEDTTEKDVGMIDSYHRTDGRGLPFLHIKAGGSVCPSSSFTIDHRLHYTYQEGRTVFRYAVIATGDDCAAPLERNDLTQDDIDYVVCHQADLCIIEAVVKRIGVPTEKVLANIQRYDNTNAACMPLVLWDFESQLKKDDDIIFTGFGAGFVNGASYFKWTYDDDAATVKK